MLDTTEPAGVRIRMYEIPVPGNEPFSKASLPTSASIITGLFQQADPQNKIKGGEVFNARQSKDLLEKYQDRSDADLIPDVSKVVQDSLNEIIEYQTLSREPVTVRLAKLKEIASSVTRVVVQSAPGNYYDPEKEDRYKGISATNGLDRLRSDQGAILSIVLSGIKNGDWTDEELMLFLNKHILTNDDQKLNALRHKSCR